MKAPLYCKCGSKIAMSVFVAILISKQLVSNTFFEWFEVSSCDNPADKGFH